MKKILISLKESAYLDFLNNSKEYEYRKKWPKEKVIAYIYVTKNKKSILMKIIFDHPIYKEKEEIAKIAEKENKEWYQGTLDYFKNNDFGFAIKALKIYPAKKEITLNIIRKMGLNPPQSYVFINDKDVLEEIENHF